MAIQTTQVSIRDIKDKKGLESIMTALKNIDGVQAVELIPDATANAMEQGVATVRYDDAETSVHALRAAISMVDYVTQPIPNESPYS